MSSDEVNFKFCFIDLKHHKVIDKDSIFSGVVKLIKSIFGTNLSDRDSDADFSKYCESENTLIVAFATMKDLHNPATYQNLINNKGLRKTFEENEEPDYHPCPMIVIGLGDLQGVIEERIKEQSSTILENQLKVVKSLNLSPKVNFFDSSIWHRYVALNENFLGNFKKVLDEIKFNFTYKKDKEKENHNLYKTNVAKEFLEFQTRLLKNSYLAKLGGGHATNVEPFQFHSATEMELKANRIVKESFSENSGKIVFQWRLLFVDDFVEDKLLIGEETKRNGSGPSKTEILEKVLSVPDNEDEKGKFWIQIEPCKSVINFIELYSKKDHQNTENIEKINDVILLDYLLNTKTTGDKSGREYSTDILKWIKDDLKIEKKLNKNLQGPLGKFWFFPISVFSYAFMEDIHQLGYKHLEEEWHIARGADPVNTPQLFRYSLFKFMEMQVMAGRSFKSIGDLIGKIFPEIQNWKKNENNKKTVPFCAKKNYHIFLKEMNAFEQLQTDKDNDSLFAKSFFDKYKDIDNTLWGHLHHLIFMLGHEPASEWPKMWDEFNIVENKLKDLEHKDIMQDVDYLRPVKKYIIDLQKTSRDLR